MKYFLILGNMNAFTHRYVYPFFRDKGMKVIPNEHITMAFNEPDQNVCRITANWYTNIEKIKYAEGIKLSKTYSKDSYKEYDNYNAIEVSCVNDIPIDYDGVMGVPITFINKYNPEQFEFVGVTESEGVGFSNGVYKGGNVPQPLIDGIKVYKRIFIKHRKS